MTQDKLAEEIARKYHDGQFRRDGKTPYIVHPEKVANMFSEEWLRAVAWLHDILEDTALTYKSLLELGVIEDIVHAVWVLSKDRPLAIKTYNFYLSQVAENELAKRVKIADMICNLSDDPTEKQKEKYLNGLAFLLNFKSSSGYKD